MVIDIFISIFFFCCTSFLFKKKAEADRKKQHMHIHSQTLLRCEVDSYTIQNKFCTATIIGQEYYGQVDYTQEITLFITLFMHNFITKI